VRCPRCDKKVRDGLSVCPNCDEILDPSQFDEDGQPLAGPDDAGAERTDVGLPPALVRPARLRPEPKKAPAPPPRAPLRPAPVERRPYLAEGPAETAPDPIEEARKSVDELSAFFRSLTLYDRVAAGAALLELVLLMLPWRHTKVDDDDVIGLIAAFPAALLSLGLVALVYFRSRRANASLAAQLNWGQVADAGLLAAFCAYFVQHAYEERILRGTGKLIVSVMSEPLWAAYAGVAVALVALGASVMTAVNNRRL
jgi:hypothetical protein